MATGHAEPATTKTCHIDIQKGSRIPQDALSALKVLCNTMLLAISMPHFIASGGLMESKDYRTPPKSRCTIHFF